MRATIQKIIKEKGREEDKLLEILMDIQKSSDLNYLTQEDLLEVAEALDLSLTRVYGIAEFYAMLSTKKRGHHVIQICNSAPCHVCDGQHVAKIFEDILGIKIGEVTPNELFSLEFVSCIGACDEAPAARIDDQVYGNLDRSKIFNILADLKRGE